MGSAIASLPPDTHAGPPPRDGTSNLRFWFIAAAGAAAAIALGWFANRLGWLLVITLVAFIVWQAASIRRLWRWQQRGLGRPPDMPAPWDEIADLAYRRTRDGRARVRALLRRMRRDARFAEALPDALVVIDSNGRIEWQSLRASEYLGLTRRDIGKSITSLLRHPDLVAVLEGRAAESLAEITLPLSERILEIRVTHLDESRRLVTARDTTQLQRLLTMRQEFVANVSHELRTPLTVIMGYLEQIDDESFDATEAKKIIRRLISPAARMKNLVEDLLLLTRLESSNTPAREQLARIDVAAMLRGMTNEVRHLQHEKFRFTVEAEEQLRLIGIEHEIYSAFNNLLVNAIRYSPDGGEITMRWFSTPRGARLEVEDHGAGIAIEHLARITERFYRVDAARSRASGGTGLGLAIVKHVLRRHGADLGVTSVVGNGSTFFCEFDQSQIWRPDVSGIVHAKLAQEVGTQQ